MDYIKSPLGVMPMSIWMRKVTIERYNALCDAISRYDEVSKEVPEEWQIERVGHLNVIYRNNWYKQ
jgi:hypothetical protein